MREIHPKPYGIFRLKKNNKNLPLLTFAKNFKTYLCNATSVTSVTKKDFNNALELFLCEYPVNTADCYSSGEHVYVLVNLVIILRAI